tara:strand:+ start:5564 stop:6724 length:1161 start_codon:yes stop_codon:yes gene_type:complete
MEGAYDAASTDFSRGLQSYGDNIGSIAQGRLQENEQFMSVKEQMAQASAATTSAQAFADAGVKAKATGTKMMEELGVNASIPGLAKGTQMFAGWLRGKALKRLPKYGEDVGGPKPRAPGEGSDPDQIAGDTDDFLSEIGSSGADASATSGAIPGLVANRPASTLGTPSQTVDPATRNAGLADDDAYPPEAPEGGSNPTVNVTEEDGAPEAPLDPGTANPRSGMELDEQGRGPEPEPLPADDPPPDTTQITGQADADIADVGTEVAEEVAPLAAETASTWASVAGMAGEVGSFLGDAMPFLGPLAAIAGLGLGIDGLVESTDEAQDTAPYDKANKAIDAANTKMAGMAQQVSADQFAATTGSNVPSFGSLAAPVFSTASAPSSFGHF